LHKTVLKKKITAAIQQMDCHQVNNLILMLFSRHSVPWIQLRTPFNDTFVNIYTL